MAQRTFRGGTALFYDPSAWLTAGVSGPAPLPGDTAVIATGTV